MIPRSLLGGCESGVEDTVMECDWRDLSWQISPNILEIDGEEVCAAVVDVIKSLSIVYV